MKIYISTPINGRKERTFAAKYKAAHARCENIKRILLADERFQDFCVGMVCNGKAEGCQPDFITTFDVNGTKPEYTEADAMGTCIAAVLDADAIYLDHGWNNSKGCRLEYQAAKIYGKDIYEHDNM